MEIVEIALMLMVVLGLALGQGVDKVDIVTELPPGETNEDDFTTVKPRPVRVVTIEQQPYLHVKDEKLEGNDRYEGFVVDLLEEAFKVTDIAYDLYLVEDGKWGSHDEGTGHWNGMIGDVEKGRADIAAAPLTITDRRETAVDFTEPLEPVTNTIVLPADSTISSLKELINQTELSYGIIRGSTTANTFLSVTEEPYNTMWEQMGGGGSESDKLFVDSISAGIEKVLNSSGTYGFITESAFGEYVVNHHERCGELRTMGKFLKHDGYGFAVNVDDEMGLKKILDDGIKKMKESGKYKELRDEWWGKGACGASSSVVASLTLLAAVLLREFL